jgi:flagellar biosynthesis protein
MKKPDTRPQPLRKAVALKYNPAENAAPVVAAKGQGHVAERILELAREHGVPIQEEPSLIEVLSKLDIDQEIPPELYALVAEVLSFIYRADRRLKEWDIGHG